MKIAPEFFFAALLMFASLSATAERETNAHAVEPCQRAWQATAVHPHSTTHFTQGLLVHEGRVFESVGQYGQSALHELDLQSGKSLRRHVLDPRYFAEGLALLDSKLYQLSWRAGLAWVYDLDFKLIARHSYKGEGWGLTTRQTAQGPRLIMSDGTPWLREMHPETFAETHRVQVRLRGVPLPKINELENVEGELFANLWHSDDVAVIDFNNGAVTSWFDFRPLRAALKWPNTSRPRETDLNGLAWDALRKKLLVTGKNWPQLFEVAIGHCAQGAPRSARPDTDGQKESGK